MSLFKPAEKEAKRLKMYVFGDSGTGKTVTSLKFPKPVMIDAEKGSDYYGSMFEFERLQTSDPKIVNQALDELLKDPKDYKTLVIDPFSIVYDRILNLQESKMKMKTLREIRYYVDGKKEGKQTVENYFLDSETITDYYWKMVAKRNESTAVDYVVLFTYDPDFGIMYNEAGEMV